LVKNINFTREIQHIDFSTALKSEGGNRGRISLTIKL